MTLFKCSRRFCRKLLAITIMTGLLIPYFHACLAGAVQINEYSLPTPNSGPVGITSGTDGALWFTEGYGNKIGRIDPGTHIVAEYPIPTPNSGAAMGITSGSDGAIWFTEGGNGDIANGADQIGRIDLITHQITEYPLTKGSGPALITSGSDGAIWFTEQFAKKIGRIAPSNPTVITEYPAPSSDPWGITLGPDNAVWFNECGPNYLARIDPTTHNIIEYPVAGICGGLTSGPNGTIWFIAYHNAHQPMIGRFTLSTKAVDEFPVPTLDSNPDNITMGPEGAIWFTELDASKIGRIDPVSLQITEYPTPTNNSVPLEIVTGPDRALWFTEGYANNIGQVNLSATLPAWIVGTPDYYATLSAAYVDVPNSGGTIEAQAVPFSENNNSFTLGSDKAVTLLGGYDSAYQSQTGYTQLHSTLTITEGSLVLDRLVIE